MRIAVVGAGVAGLGTALALGREGHEVVLVERDATPLPHSPDEAFEWDRRGAPQVRHSHALLARLRNLLRDRYPDVLASLLAAGATEMRFADDMPPTIEDRSPLPEDEDLVALACRRTTFEWVLRRAVLAEPGVTLRDGVAGLGLVATAPPTGGRPTVTGLRLGLATDETEVLGADLVVSAGGRRAPLPAWLDEIGVDLPEDEEDTGIVYLSRFYRLRPGASTPVRGGPIGGDLGYLKYGVFEGDNATFSVTLSCPVDDHDLRTRLRDPDTFTRAAAELTATAPWVAPGLADAITPVHLMTGLINRQRHFLDATGRPRALGVVAVGDAHTCTNPLYGRGCSLAMVQAVLLADAVGAHPDDPEAMAVDYEGASAAQVLPWYAASLAQDRAARAALEAQAGAPDEGGEAAPAAESAPGMAELIREGLLPAARVDAAVFRAFVRGFNLLDPPEALLADTAVVSSVLAAYQDRANRPPEPPLGPRDRAALLAALA